MLSKPQRQDCGCGGGKYNCITKKAMQKKDGLPFLTLIGKSGAGKSHLAIAAVWDWFEATGKSVSYAQVPDMISLLQGLLSLDARDKSRAIDNEMHYWSNCSLLILDDLGMGIRTDWRDGIIDQIIDHRYIRQLATIVTSNLGPESWPMRTASRLSEGQTFVLDAPDYRNTK